MRESEVERVAAALLYEGYMLYPYRPSAVKNRQRFNFGVLYPEAWCQGRPGSDSWYLQAEFLVTGAATAQLDVRLRFLQLVDRQVAEVLEPVAELAPATTYQPVPALAVEGRTYSSWQEATEREVVVSCPVMALSAPGFEHSFQEPAGEQIEPLRTASGLVAGVCLRRRAALHGALQASGMICGDDVARVTVRVVNQALTDGSNERGAALMQSLVSAHLIARVRDGAFCSLLDPPPELRAAASACRQHSVWPVLAGEEGTHDTLLCSPIVVYDYPRLAPESRGDFFDGTEIDEMLSLRVLTLTDAEKLEMAQADELTRRLLERTEAMGEAELMSLHGTLRDMRRPGAAR